MANRTKRTKEKDEEFFATVIESGGNITRACEAFTYSRRSVYEWKAADPQFAARLDDAVEKGTDVLEEEAKRRAHDGWEEPVFYQGAQCGAVRKYSDTLLIFLLKGNRPDKYRERIGIDFAKATPEQIYNALLEMPDDQFSRLLERRKSR